MYFSEGISVHFSEIHKEENLVGSSERKTSLWSVLYMKVELLWKWLWTDREREHEQTGFMIQCAVDKLLTCAIGASLPELKYFLLMWTEPKDSPLNILTNIPVSLVIQFTMSIMRCFDCCLFDGILLFTECCFLPYFLPLGNSYKRKPSSTTNAIDPAITVIFTHRMQHWVEIHHTSLKFSFICQCWDFLYI